MIITTVERLRPRPSAPDPTWSAETLRSIVQAEALPTRHARRRGRRSRARRATALVAAGTLAAVAIGWGVVTVRSSPTIAQPAGGNPERVVGTDVRALTSAERTTIVSTCGDDADPAPVETVHYARAIRAGDGEPTSQAAVVNDTRGEYRICVLPGPREGASDIAGYGPHLLGAGGLLTPDARRPLRHLLGSQQGFARLDDTIIDTSLLIAYATDPSVDRVQVRVTGAGSDGRWFEGRASGGFVVIPVVVPSLDAPGGTDPDLVLEARALDRTDHLVADDRQGDLDGNEHGGSFWG